MPKCHAANSPAMTMTWLIVPVIFWPMRSTRKPLTSRSTAPASVGTATTKPFWAGLSIICLAMIGASGPIRFHTMKARSK